MLCYNYCIIFVINFCYYYRGHLNRFDYCNCFEQNRAKKEEEEKKKREYIRPYGWIDYETEGLQNLAFQSDTPHTLMRTPQHKSIDGIYATVDLSVGSHSKLPFTPDTNLRLDLKTPNDSEVGSRYRGSSDSGLYSELSIDPKPTSNKNQNQSFPGPYATSLETLQSLGPEYKFEPPAGQSSPKLPIQRTKEEIEALYAKPVKRNKRKKLNSTGNMDSKEPQRGGSSLQELNLSSQISIENLPQYHPRSMGSRSGSSNIVDNPIPGSTGALNNPGSGSTGALNNLNKSRSENEMTGNNRENDSQPIKKKKKRKRRKSTENTEKKQAEMQGSLNELNAGSQISMETLPQYQPRGSRSGSTSNIVNNPMSSSRSGSVNVLNLSKSRSVNEIYITDGTGSRGSTMTIETDV